MAILFCGQVYVFAETMHLYGSFRPAISLRQEGQSKALDYLSGMAQVFW